MGGIRRDIAREHAGRVSTASERRGGSLAGRPRGDEEGLDARPDQLVLGHDAAARQNHGIDSQLALHRERRLRRGGEGRGGEDLLLGVHNHDTTHEPRWCRTRQSSATSVARRRGRSRTTGTTSIVARVPSRRISIPKGTLPRPRSRGGRPAARRCPRNGSGRIVLCFPEMARQEPRHCSRHRNDDAGWPGARANDTARRARFPRRVPRREGPRGRGSESSTRGVRDRIRVGQRHPLARGARESIDPVGVPCC